MTVNEIIVLTETIEIEPDKLYEAVQELVEAICCYEGDEYPPDSEEEARGIAAKLITHLSEGRQISIGEALRDFWKEK